MNTYPHAQSQGEGVNILYSAVYAPHVDVVDAASSDWSARES